MSGGSPEGPRGLGWSSEGLERVGGPSQTAGTCPWTHPKVRDGSGDSFGGLRRVGDPLKGLGSVGRSSRGSGMGGDILW